MRVDTDIDREIRQFVNKLVHDIGHEVSHLQILADTLRQRRRFAEIRGFAEIAQRVSEVSHSMARYVRMMHLLTHQDSVVCDFLRDVLQPAVWFAGRGDDLIPRLHVDQSARNAPEVTVRPTLAIRGLMLLLGDATSITLLCDTRKTRGRVSLRIHLEQPPRDAAIEQRGIRLLQGAGANVTPSAAETGYSLALSFKQGHNPS